MTSRAEFEKAAVQEEKRARVKRAEDEKLRRLRRTWETILKTYGLCSPRLKTLEERKSKLIRWIARMPTNSEKIRRYCQTRKKVEKAIRAEMRRLGKPRRGPFDSDTLMRAVRGDEALEQYFVEEAAEIQRWRDMKKTPEGRAERLKMAQFIREGKKSRQYNRIVSGVYFPKRRKAEAKPKARAAHA